MSAKLSVAWLLSYISIASFSATIITPALPAIQNQFALANGQIEWVVSSFLIGYVIGQLIYGPIANRWGRLFSLRLGLIINLVGVLVSIVSLIHFNYKLLIIGRLISALGAASGLACTFMLINEWLPEEQRKTAMAYTILSFTLGIGLAVTLGGVISEYLTWSYCFVFLAIHGLVMLLGTRVFTETLKMPQPIDLKTILNNYKKALISSNLVVFSIVVGFCSSIGYCFSAAGPQVANKTLNLSSAAYGYWNLINMAGMLAGGLWSKRLLSSKSGLQVIAIGLGGCVFGCISLLLMIYFHSSSALWFFLSSFILYLFSGSLFAGGSFIASNALSDKASASSMMSFINMSTATLAVVIMGYLESNALRAFAYMMLFMWLLVAGLFLIKKSSIKTVS